MKQKLMVLVMSGAATIASASSPCSAEKQTEVMRVATQLKEKFSIIEPKLDVKAAACNIQLLGSVQGTLSKGDIFDTTRKELETDCQQMLNVGLIRIYRGETLPIDANFGGACVSFVRVRVPVGYGT